MSGILISDFNQLGTRICIIGPSTSGKSTLALAIADKIGTPVHHLDQIVHVPGTDYRFRPEAEWIAEHDEVIKAKSWVIDGNYSICMKQRFQYATAVIQLDPNRLLAVYRYVKRSFINDKNRPGVLKNATAEFSWRRVKFTLFDYPKFQEKHNRLLSEFSHLKIIRLGSMRELNILYQAWNMQRI